MALPLTTLDSVGLILFAWATLGYHITYVVLTRRDPLATVKGKIHLYRRTWVKRILDKDNQMLAVQTVRNLLMTASFMASSALLVVAVVLNLLLQGVAPPRGVPIASPELLEAQLILVGAMFAFSFIAMLLSIRYLNQFVILIGADPDLIDHIERVDAVTYLSNLINRASNRYTYGQRGFYFAVPIIAWMFSPWAFLATTVGLMVYLMLYLDFKKWDAPKYLVKPSQADPTRTPPPP